LRYKKITSRSLSTRALLAKGKSFALSSALIPVLIVAFFGFIVYELYHKFFATTPFSSASDKLAASGAAHLTDRNTTEGTSLDGLRASLSGQGLDVGDIHRNDADSLNALLDNVSVDHAHVVAIITNMSAQTFQLTAIAYGQRELRNYRNSFIHLLNPSVWGDLFSEKKLYGTLRYHLGIVLSSSELGQLSQWLSTVP
jgi:hypothetical protein